MKKNNTKLLVIFTAVFAFVALIYVVIVNSKILSTQDFPLHLIGTLIGMVLSAFITVLLLKGQTAIEEENDLGLRIYDKKQEVYFEFINCLERITKDGKINVPGTKGYNSSDEDELQTLIYQLGKVQMIANKETSLKATRNVAEVLKIINENEANKASLYSTFAGEVFKLVNLFKKDIYGEKIDEKPITKDDFKETLVVAGFGEELEKNEANVIADFLDLTSKRLEEFYNIKSQFLADGIKKENAKNAADTFVQTEKGYLQIWFQKSNEKDVWIEFGTDECGCGVREKNNDGSWAFWSKNKNESVNIDKQVALKTLSFVESFAKKDETEKKQFVADFIASFKNFDSFLKS